MIAVLALTLVALAWGCAGAESGQEGNPEESGIRGAESLVAEAVDRGLVPGAVLLVARDGEVLLERAYGYSQAMNWEGGRGFPGGEERDPGPVYEPRPLRLESPVSMTAGTVFDLASVTKVMATTMALMVLEGRGLVELDAPVGRYLPAFGVSGKEGITLRHLLTHTSGLAQWQPLYYSASTAEGTVEAIAEMPLQWGVGEGRQYSDLGFMVLGTLVEEVAQRPLGVFLETEIYGPLGLTHTGFNPAAGPFAATSHGNPFEYRMVHDTAFGYRFSGDPYAWDGWRTHTLVGEVNDGNAHHAFGGVAGHAGLFSTAGELNHLLQLLLDGGITEQGTRIFPEETVRRFLTPVLPTQALGWQVPDWGPPGSFSHTGFTGTFVMGIPDRNLAVVLLTNRQNFGVDRDTRYPELGPLQRQVVEAILAGG